MVTLHCTKKFLDRMEIAPQATSDKDSLAQADEPLPAPRNSLFGAGVGEFSSPWTGTNSGGSLKSTDAPS